MRTPQVVDRSLVAWAVGALVGVVTFLAEAALGPPTFRWGSLAAYSLAGGGVAVASRSLLAAFVSAPAARAGALGAIAAFGSLHALHYVNVQLLPGEHYLAWRSLAFDAPVAIPIIAAAILLGRARWAQAARERWAGVGATFGALTLMAGLVVAKGAAPRSVRDPERHGSGPDLVLVILDSVRADRFSVESPHPATPELTRLARRGRAYVSAWAASSWTNPSVARILSAGSTDATLAQRLVSAGYQAAAFTDNPHLTPGSSLMRGFDRVERSVGGWRSIVTGTALGEVLERLAPGDDRVLAAKAITWMERQSGPFFVYVHLMDSHTPYRFPPLEGKRRPGRQIEFPCTGMDLTPDEADSIRARYDAGVHRADAQVGRLLAAVEARGRPFFALVTSDHGESLGEDGRWFHGQTLAPELLAIPLLLLGKGVEPGTVDSPVGHAAIASTLLAAASIPCDSCTGTDLRGDVFPRFVEGALPPNLAYRSDGHYKLVVDFQKRRRFLYDRISDPGERRDIEAVVPDVADLLASALPVPESATVVRPEQLERLRALGYTEY